MLINNNVNTNRSYPQLNRELVQAIIGEDANQVESILNQPLVFPRTLITKGIHVLINNHKTSTISLMNMHKDTLSKNVKCIRSLFKQIITHANSQPNSLLFSLNCLEKAIQIFDTNSIRLTSAAQNALGTLTFWLIKEVKILSNFPEALERLEDAPEIDSHRKINHLFDRLMPFFPSLIAVASNSSLEKLEHLKNLESQLPFIQESGKNLNQFLLFLFSKIPHLMKANQSHGLGHLFLYAVLKHNVEIANALIDHPHFQEILSDVQEGGYVASYGFFELLKELIEFPIDEVDHRYFPERLLSKMTPDLQFKHQEEYSYRDLLNDLFSFDKELFNKVRSMDKVQQFYKENLL